MKKIKLILWNLPFVGILYIFICLTNIKFWINEDSVYLVSGLIIQLISIASIPCLLHTF